jgi:hypothetical protein
MQQWQVRVEPARLAQKPFQIATFFWISPGFVKVSDIGLTPTGRWNNKQDLSHDTLTLALSQRERGRKSTSHSLPRSPQLTNDQ